MRRTVLILVFGILFPMWAGAGGLPDILWISAKDLTAGQRQDPAAFQNLPPCYPDTAVVREDWKRNYEPNHYIVRAANKAVNDLPGTDHSVP